MIAAMKKDTKIRRKIFSERKCQQIVRKAKMIITVGMAINIFFFVVSDEFFMFLLLYVQNKSIYRGSY